MHPFWAVRRITHQKLQTLPREAATEKGFTCGIEEREYSVVTVGSYKGSSVATTLYVRIPFLTNSVDLNKGHELIWESLNSTPQKAKKQEETYKDQARKRQSETTNQNKRVKKMHEQPKTPAKGGTAGHFEC